MTRVFLIIAAARFSPSKVEGIDGTLRAFAHTPVGPFLLILVALGLVAFGLFSWCEAQQRGFLATVTGIGMDMYQASANIAEGPSGALGNRVCLPPSASELMSTVVSAVARPRTRLTPRDERIVGSAGRQNARRQR